MKVTPRILAETDPKRLLSDVVASVPGVAKNGTNQHTRAGFDIIKPSSKGGTSAEYLAARLKRDVPDMGQHQGVRPDERRAPGRSLTPPPGDTILALSSIAK